jgi:hypothetical protein
VMLVQYPWLLVLTYPSGSDYVLLDRGVAYVFDGANAADLRDPPPTASPFANCSVPALQQVEHGSLHPSVLLLRGCADSRVANVSMGDQEPI